MFLMKIIFMIIMMISNVMMLLSLIISKKSITDREKNSPFECGFNPNSSARIPFSLHFFLITVIFLIFDVEITLILPMILNFKMSNYMYWMTTSMTFIMILIVGVYHEWNQNMLNWSN